MSRAPSSKTSAHPAPGSPDEAFVARFEDAKRQSVAQLLFRCARRLNDHAVATLEAPPGAPKLRAAHTSLFPHLELGGIRLTVLAQRLGISKQAVGQLVDDLEAMGMLERAPDPADGRAKLIIISSRGRQWLWKGLAHLGAVEQQLREALGGACVDALHEALQKLDAYLDAPEP